MKFLKKYFLFSLLLLSTALADEPVDPTAPWMKPRELSSFQTLLKHSPFSLATAEDASPLSERYMLTGIITLGGEDQIFIMDRNDQSREILTKKPNSKGMALVNIIRDADPNKLKATIRVNGETGVINNTDLADNNGKGSRPGMPNSPYSKNGSHLPATPRYPGQGYPPSPQNQGFPPSNYNNRRVIRRPPISGPSGGSQNYQPGIPNSYQPPPSSIYSGYPGYPGTPSHPPSNYQPGTMPPSGRPPNSYQQRIPVNNGYDSGIPSY
ncbi:MAG: hypothetical protein FJ390_05505 [Verrucomicrobia bacterium]|nr:hypothetical protein [Verrucomicrobiota bacterium]